MAHIGKVAVGVVLPASLLLLGGCSGTQGDPSGTPSPSFSALTEDNSVYAMVRNDSGRDVVVRPSFGEEEQPEFGLAAGKSKELVAKSDGFGQMKLEVAKCGGVVEGKKVPGWVAFIKGWVATPPDKTTNIGTDGPTTQEFKVFDSTYVVTIDKPNGLNFDLTLADCKG